MQRHRAISHLFDTQHQFCPCDISDAAICKHKCIIVPFWIHNTSFVLVIYEMQWYAKTNALQNRFEYTTPILPLWYIKRRNMQIHKRYCTVLNTQHLFCPCDISDAAICKNIGRFCTFLNAQHQLYVHVTYQMQHYAKELGRYCTFLNLQHQFCPCDTSDAAICKDIGQYWTVLNTQYQVCPCDISDAAIYNALGDIVPLWIHICNDIGDIAPFLIESTSFVLVIYRI